MKSIPYGRQEITKADIEVVSDTLNASFLTQGPVVEDFENGFASYVNAKHAVAVSNGTAALHLSCMALGLKKSQKVITTPITFAASANSVLYCGGEVDFVDIDPDTFLMDLNQVETKLKSAKPGEYAGIIPVDFTGLPVDTEKLRGIADRYGLWIIEDACHSPGGFFLDSKKEKIKCGHGKYADLTCFSFHPVKHIACGEGGMITTENKDLKEKIKTLRSHGITKNTNELVENHGGWYYEMQFLGFNYRLSDINSALGLSQLSRADKGLRRRIDIARMYEKEFDEIAEINCQLQPNNFQNAYHLFVVCVSRRKELYDYLRENQVYCQIHYIPVHLQPYYQELGWEKGDFPYAESYYETCISLPMFPSLKVEEQNFVISLIKGFYQY